MKKKLSLSELNVKSFTTSEEKEKIGGSIDFPSEPLVCGGSMQCTEGFNCTSGIGTGSMGPYFCQIRTVRQL